MDLIVTHAGCLDGWTSAIVLERDLQALSGEDWQACPPEAQSGLRPATVEKPAGALLCDYWAPEEPPSGRLRVFFVDCSPAREDLEYLQTAYALPESGLAVSVIVIDHHATTTKRANDGYYDQPPVPVSFYPGLQPERQRSACVLAWQFCHGRDGLPLLFQYVEDRDLWKWELPESREVSAYLAALPRDRERWWRAVEAFEEDPAQLEMAAGVGALIRSYQAQLVDRVLEAATFKRVPDPESPSGYAVVGILNTPVLVSESASALLEREPKLQMVAVFRHEGGERCWSLRSRAGSGVDVAAIAEAYGGGGHPCAAGFVERPGDPAFAA
jgi:oligoribonuclease NrnB/cAMP/cGMP phosphodiesterase (DHH superfamily)